MKNRRGNGEGSIFKDNNGLWHAKICIGHYANGNRKYKEFKGAKKADVYEKKIKYERSHEYELKCNDGQYFGEFIVMWMNTVKKNAMKPSSYDRAMRTVEHNIIPLIGKYRIGTITTKIIQDELINVLFYEPNQKTGKPNSCSLINKAFVYTNACFNYAVKTKQVASNPCDGVIVPRQVLRPPKQIRFFSDDEIRALFCAVDNANQPYAWAFKFMVYTGLRRGEMIALKKECVDLDKKRIYICRTAITVQRTLSNGKKKMEQICQETTKNDRPRYVPLSNAAVECIRSAYNACLHDDEYVTTGTTEMVPQYAMRSAYKAICKKACLDNSQGLHTLRHSFASKMIRSGVDVKTVSELLGHASTSFTYKTYVHLIEEQRVNAVNMIEF